MTMTAPARSRSTRIEGASSTKAPRLDWMLRASASVWDRHR